MDCFTLCELYELWISWQKNDKLIQEYVLLQIVQAQFGLCSIYQETMSPELRHKERNSVLSLWNNERWHLTWYIEHHPHSSSFNVAIMIRMV